MQITQEIQLQRTHLWCSTLALLMLGTPGWAAGPRAGDGDSDSDRKVHRHRAVHVVDCPEVKVLGAGGARVLPLSRRVFLGVEASNLTPELREHFGAPADAGVMLSRIVEESAAEAAGLSVGDVVTRIDGEEISSPSELGRVIRRQQGGDVVEIEYLRDGQESYAQVTLDEKEGCSIDIGDPLRSLRLEDLSALGEFGIEIGGEALESTLEGLGEILANQDWEKHLKGLEDIEFDHIEERMERVQERLERLEERLERDFGRQVERAEREMERARERAEHERRREVEEVEREAERQREEAEREIERAERERERAERERERERERSDNSRADAEVW